MDPGYCSLSRFDPITTAFLPTDSRGGFDTLKNLSHVQESWYM